MKKTLCLLVMLCAAGAASCTQPANPLIGTWNVDAKQDPGCKTPLVFAEKSLTSPDPWGKTRSIPVAYTFAGPEKYPYVVYVTTDTGVAEHVTYRFSSHNTMTESTAWPGNYTRG